MSGARALGSLAICLTCAAPAAAELDKKELKKQFPAKARVKKAKLKVERSLRYELPRGVEVVAEPAAIKATLGSGKRKAHEHVWRFSTASR